jgi:hypothetical protein
VAAAVTAARRVQSKLRGSDDPAPPVLQAHEVTPATVVLAPQRAVQLTPELTSWIRNLEGKSGHTD